MKKFSVLLCALLFMAAGCKKAETVITGEVDSSEIDVGVKVAGRLSKILAHEGDSVRRDQRIGYLESKELDAKLKTVQAALAEANQQFDFATKSYERVKNLFETGVVPKQQYDEAKYKYEASRQKVKATEGQLNEVQAYFDELFIKSPIDGEVVQNVSREGEIVSPGYPIFTVLNLSDQWVVFNLREDKLPAIKKGMEVEVTFPALGKTYPMTINYISALGQFAKWKSTNEQGSFDLKTFEAHARSKTPLPDLRPGMTALVKIK